MIAARIDRNAIIAFAAVHGYIGATDCNLIITRSAVKQNETAAVDD